MTDLHSISSDLVPLSDNSGLVGQLIILRHGQSVYNLENRFTGELDVGLTDYGRQEALVAARCTRCPAYAASLARLRLSQSK